MGPELLLKRVQREKVMGDIQFRGAISDFTVIKKQIAEADYDDLLVRYNEDDIYGDGNNFEIACTKAIAEQWEREGAEKAAAAAAAAAEEAEAAKPGRRKKRAAKPESKPWVSQGSEREIEEESIKPSGAPKVSIQFFRKRREFGQPVTFSDADSVELWNSAQMECRPFKEKTPSVYFLEADAAVQAVPETTSIEVQATPARAVPMATQYVPREMSEAEKREHVADDGSLAAFLRRVDPLMCEALQQNECYDIFKDDFASLADDDAGPGAGAETMVETHSFTSLAHGKGKKVMCVDWVPGMKGCVAVSCAEQQSFEERVATGGQARHGAVLVWHFADPIHPQMVLEAPVDVHSFAFNPVNSALVAGGLANGQVCYWDVSELRAELARKKTTGADGDGPVTVPTCQPTYLSEIPDSHVLPVTDVRWMGSDCAVTKPRGALESPEPKTGECNFFASIAADGKALFWDIVVKRDSKKREFLFTPTHKINLNRGELAGTLQAVRFNFSPDLGPGGSTDFFATSMDGEVAQCNFVKPEDEAHPEHTKMSCTAHAGPARSIDRSPFFPDVLLSVGDWTFKLWKEGEKNPIFSSPSADAYLTAGAFSPTRPGVLFTAKQDGTVDVWDLLERSNEAFHTARVNSAPLSVFKFWPGGDKKTQLLAVGDNGGVLRVMDLPRSLRKPVAREKDLMEKFLAREMERVADASARGEAREAELARMEDAAAAAAAMPEAKPDKRKKGQKELTPDEIKEAEYQALEEQFLIQMGLKEVVEVEA